MVRGTALWTRIFFLSWDFFWIIYKNEINVPLSQ